MPARKPTGFYTFIKHKVEGVIAKHAGGDYMQVETLQKHDEVLQEALAAWWAATPEERACPKKCIVKDTQAQTHSTYSSTLRVVAIGLSFSLLACA